MQYGNIIPTIYPTGVFIQSIEQTKTSDESGGENVFIATLTNHTQQQFVVKNGHTGSACEGINEIRASVDNSAGTPSVEVVETDAGAKKDINFIFKNLKGEKGDIALTEEVKQYIDSRFEEIQKQTRENNKLLKKLESNAIVKKGFVESTAIDSVVETGFYAVGYDGYSGVLLVFNVGGSAGVIQFLKDGYGEWIPWKYRNAVDGDTKRWGAWRIISTREN